MKLLFSLVAFALSDLIGQNRLGNNVESHKRHRNSRLEFNYLREISEFLRKTNGPLPKISKFVTNGNSVKIRRQNARRAQYQMMMKHQ